MKYYLLNEQQVQEIVLQNQNTQFITTICDYGLGPCIAEDDVNSPERSYLKNLTIGQIPQEIIPEPNRFLPVDPD